MTLALAPTQTGEVWRVFVPLCECSSCPDATHGGYRGTPGGPVVQPVLAPVQQRRQRAERPKRRTIATWTPSVYECDCPSCEDATHGGTLGKPAVWTWH